MAEPRLEPIGEGSFRVSGELTFATVPGLLAASEPLFRGGNGEVRIDLSAVQRSDSAGLALLVEWTRRARGSGGIAFRNVPRQMLEIARMSSLAAVLPLDGAA